MTLQPQRKEENFIVAVIADENDKCIGFCVTDKNLERVDTKIYPTAGKAFCWANENYKALV